MPSLLPQWFLCSVNSPVSQHPCFYCTQEDCNRDELAGRKEGLAATKALEALDQSPKTYLTLLPKKLIHANTGGKETAMTQARVGHGTSNDHVSNGTATARLSVFDGAIFFEFLMWSVASIMVTGFRRLEIDSLLSLCAIIDTKDILLSMSLNCACT